MNPWLVSILIAAAIFGVVYGAELAAKFILWLIDKHPRVALACGIGAFVCFVRLMIFVIALPNVTP